MSPHRPTADPSKACMRILDANANRAAEGLRTLEESARFVLCAHALTADLKSLRHDLTNAMSRLSRVELLRARDTGRDVGTTTTTPGEQSRTDIVSIVSAATGRTQQALRCLEEYGKTIDGVFAASVEQIRYRCYDVFASLELVFMAGNRRHARLHDARLYALIDASENEQAMIERIRLLADAGVDILQLRDRHVDDRTLYQRASVGSCVARENDVLWIVNDRADIAAASSADGVHVGQEELPVAEVRRIVGADAIVGLSTHDIHQVREAFASTADYIGCGPVFPGQTKQFEHFPGCEFLREVATETSNAQHFAQVRPAFAIGGIGPSNVCDVVETGFGRIAVTGALSGSSARENAAVLRTTLETVALPEHSAAAITP
ncbi:thiamine phosphate synthase [Aporhodopirellula aestuarii]|uniref:Thiamine-phosphate synthase n=1 Tax=Aporhodopirellula aestuarii TaxID=2950107 RepID=A0ABT0U821_9BACT|nr:thiamine phosphate synthase [Aporhodopirellula aestuarii]MCM2372506.1 thiamine phosphate synthase [Aporhodopirellula aestuarii]